MENKLPEENLIKEQIHTTPIPKRPFPKLLIALGTALLLLLMFFIVFTFLRIQKIKDLKNTPATQTLPTGEILFSSVSTKLDAKKSGSIDITINTGGNQIGGVIIAVKYNPILLQNVKLENIMDSKSAISQALIPVGGVTYETANGAALMTLKLPQGQALSGKGVVARLYFTKSALDVAIKSTDITLLPLTNFITVKEGIIPLNKNRVTVSF